VSSSSEAKDHTMRGRYVRFFTSFRMTEACLPECNEGSTRACEPVGLATGKSGNDEIRNDIA